jgi:hypothetical protein
LGGRSEVQVRVSGRPLGASKLGFVFPPPLPSLLLLFAASLRQFLEQTLFGELGGSTFEVSKSKITRPTESIMWFARGGFVSEVFPGV